MPKTLLLADDSLTIRRVVELTFADEDVVVTTVGDGGRAMARIQSLPPDIVLADAAMPAPSGYDVAAFVKATPALAHIPVILLTPAFERIDEARARAAGCDAVLAKPFELTLLVARVKELLRAADAKKAETDGTCRAGVPPAEHPHDSCRAGGSPADVPPADIAPADCETLPDVSLEQLFDSIDASTGAPSIHAANGSPPPADSRLVPLFPDWTPSSPADGVDAAGPSLDDYFDMVDEAIRRSQDASGEASFEARALLFPPHTVAPVDSPLAANSGADAGANGTANGTGAPRLDDVALIFLSLLETPVVPPSPRLIEEALRRLLGGS